MLGKLLGVVSLFLLFINETLESGKIVGGRPARPGEFPYQVSLRYAYMQNHFCGGSILSERYIVTAAHCVVFGTTVVLADQIVALVGQIDEEVDDNSTILDIDVIYPHPDYDYSNYFNDIAVLELSTDIVYNNFVQPINIRKTRPEAGTHCVVTGWGYQDYEDHTLSETLLAANVTVTDLEACNASYVEIGYVLDYGEVCAAEPGRDACQGDSGGPLVCDGLLTGLVSDGEGCAEPNYPGIYTDVSQFVEWIESIIAPEYVTDTVII